jgi:hypothetical protein
MFLTAQGSASLQENIALAAKAYHPVKSSGERISGFAPSDLGKIVVLGIGFVAAATPAPAVEGAMGRTLPGLWVNPQEAVVGPKSGFSFTAFPIGYMGAIGGGRLVPIGGSIFANVDASVSSNWLVPQYVYKVDNPKVSLAPINWESVTGTLQFNDISRARSKSTTGLADVMFAPLTAGIHFQQEQQPRRKHADLRALGTFPNGEPRQPRHGRMDLHAERRAHLHLGKARPGIRQLHRI